MRHNGSGLEDIMSTLDQSSPLARNTIFKDLVEEVDFARERGVSVRTCQRERQLRISPPFIKMGRRIYYRTESIKEWICGLERSGNHTSPFPSQPTGKRRLARQR